MTKSEINRFKILSDVIEKKINQINAAKMLHFSERQIRRLISKFKAESVKSWVLTQQKLSL